jgi:hypothetical protein
MGMVRSVQTAARSADTDDARRYRQHIEPTAQQSAEVLPTDPDGLRHYLDRKEKEQRK